MNTLEKIAHVKQLWGLLIPYTALPPDRFLAQWAERCPVTRGPGVLSEIDSITMPAPKPE
jgi:hypothetical protein